ncbi:hypothetical protein FRB93_005210 [Tulasnella sp. JGI-2019a]|nr:hypothetical protein FRB93_005210 [Tulasnella sp. JGI-2019a]
MIEVEVAPSSIPVTGTGAMNVGSANPPTRETNTVTMDLELARLSTQKTRVADIEVESLFYHSRCYGLNRRQQCHNNTLVHPEDLIDYNEDNILSDVEDKDSIMVNDDSDVESQVDGVCQRLAVKR